MFALDDNSAGELPRAFRHNDEPRERCGWSEACRVPSCELQDIAQWESCPTCYMVSGRHCCDSTRRMALASGQSEGTLDKL